MNVIRKGNVEETVGELTSPTNRLHVEENGEHDAPRSSFFCERQHPSRTGAVHAPHDR